jgi:hypothetical protein
MAGLSSLRLSQQGLNWDPEVPVPFSGLSLPRHGGKEPRPPSHPGAPRSEGRFLFQWLGRNWAPRSQPAQRVLPVPIATDAARASLHHPGLASATVSRGVTR